MLGIVLAFAAPAWASQSEHESNDIQDSSVVSGRTVAQQQNANSSNAVTNTLPLQGDCTGLTFDRNDANSTVACPGRSTAPLTFAFGQDGGESCLYIDNMGRQPVSYLVPLKTQEEWIAFKNSAKNGTLSDSVELVYGCSAQTAQTPCGTSVQLSSGRHNDTQTVSVTADATATFTCVATNSCGQWSYTSLAGSCPVNGSCGGANNAVYRTVPTTDLCASGTASSVAGTGPWTWTCAGLYSGTTASCSARRSVDGGCGTSNGARLDSAPTSGLCVAGNASAVTGTGPWSWTCSGSNGGTTASCSASVREVASCGAAAGGTYSLVPKSNLCAGGTASAVALSGNSWLWSCVTAQGTSASCSASLAAVPFDDGEYCGYQRMDPWWLAAGNYYLLNNGVWGAVNLGGGVGYSMSAYASGSFRRSVVIPQSGYYYTNYVVDNYGAFYVNGVPVIDLREETVGYLPNSNFQNDHGAWIYYEAGINNLTITYRDGGWAYGVAATIYGGSSGILFDLKQSCANRMITEYSYSYSDGGGGW